MASHLRDIEPEKVLARKLRKFVRKQFYAAGVNDMWSMDQHDKWLKHGVACHVGIDPFSGRILWAKAWWTNRNSKLVCGWFLDVVESLGGTSAS